MFIKYDYRVDVDVSIVDGLIMTVVYGRRQEINIYLQMNMSTTDITRNYRSVMMIIYLEYYLAEQDS